MTLPSVIDVVFESGVTATGVDINTDGVAVTEYYTHPSFRDGSSVYKTTAYDQSGWDKELSGYWVNKFELFDISIANILNQYTDMAIFDFHDYLSTIGESEILFTENTETHVVKNTEWGAIAYLSQSKYGKMGNSNFTGVNKEIFINSALRESYTISGRSAGGIGGGNIMGTTTLIPTTYTYNNGYSYDGHSCTTQWILTCNGEQDLLKGTGASTTGNIYGVYDIVGGYQEYVMANYNNTLASSGFSSSFFTTESNKKYYDSYDSTKTYILGDATYETSGWYNDNAVNMTTTNPFLTRGGLYSGSTDTGIFSYTSSTGYDNNTTARIIIIP